VPRLCVLDPATVARVPWPRAVPMTRRLARESGQLIDQGLARRRSLRRGRPRAGVSSSGFMQYHTPYLAAVAEGLARAGEIQSGIAAIEETVTRTIETGERWCLAELPRIKGELPRQQGDAQSFQAAEDCLPTALDVAREQGALSWELRIAMSLARMPRDRGRRVPGRVRLAYIKSPFMTWPRGAGHRCGRRTVGTVRLRNLNRRGPTSPEAPPMGRRHAQPY
jgi:hypothetical protein